METMDTRQQSMKKIYNLSSVKKSMKHRVSLESSGEQNRISEPFEKPKQLVEETHDEITLVKVITPRQNERANFVTEATVHHKFAAERGLFEMDRDSEQPTIMADHFNDLEPEKPKKKIKATYSAISPDLD